MQSLQRNRQPIHQRGNDNDSVTHIEVCFSFDEDEFYKSTYNNTITCHKLVEQAQRA